MYKSSKNYTLALLPSVNRSFRSVVTSNILLFKITVIVPCSIPVGTNLILCSDKIFPNISGSISVAISTSLTDNPSNTFLDIGSCLNPLLNLEGWKYTRGYLTSYWLNSNSPFGRQVDVWK